VTERTREIGVRVAVGATEEAIQLQFLGEAIMLSLVGGGAGVFFGIFGSYLIGPTLHWPMQMSVESVLVAAMFSIAVGSKDSQYSPAVQAPMSAEEILAIYKVRGIGDGASNLAEKSTATSAQPTPLIQGAPRAPKNDSVVVWKLHPDKSMEPVKIALGITDHAFTEVTAVLRGDLKEGDDVIIRSVVAKPQAFSALTR
jgi:hypothetical protein